MSKTKFIKGLSSKEPVNLWLGVSLDNSKLQGDNLAKFVTLVNRHASKIKFLYVVVGCEVYGQYVGKEIAKIMGDKWVEQATEHMNSQKLKVPFKFVRWTELTSTEQYSELLNQVEKNYQLDVNFQTIVDTLSEEFRNRKKCKFENARNYLLSECAVYLMFDGKTTYPSKELNLALQYVLAKYKKPDELEYVGYDISGDESVKQSKIKGKTELKLLEAIEDQSQKMVEQAKLISELRQQVFELRTLMLLLVKKDNSEAPTLCAVDSEPKSPKIKIGFF